MATQADARGELEVEGRGATVLPLLARFFFAASVFWLFIGLFAGFTYSLQFISGIGNFAIPPNPVHSAGRLRMVHTSALIYGFLLSGFLGALVASPARRSLSPLVGRALEWIGFLLLEYSLLSGITMLLYGESQPLIWGEVAPRYTKILALGLGFSFLGYFIGVARQAPLLGVGFPLIAIAGGVGTVLQAFRSIQPSVGENGLADSHFYGFLQAHLINLFFFPLALGLTLDYSADPIDTTPRRGYLIPFSAFVLLVSGLAGGARLYVTPLPSEVLGWEAPISSAVYELTFVALLVKAWKQTAALKDPGQRGFIVWLRHGIIFGFLVSLQRLFLISPSHLRFVQFSDWIIAHHHLLFLGTLGFFLFAFFLDAWQRRPHSTAWRFPMLAALHLTLTLIGLVFMAFALMAARVVESGALHEGLPWSEILLQMKPFWIVRTAAGVLIVLGQICFLVNLATTRRANSKIEGVAT